MYPVSAGHSIALHFAYSYHEYQMGVAVKRINQLLSIISTRYFTAELSLSISIDYYRLVGTTVYYCGPGSSVGIATVYGVDGPGIESRWGAKFSAPLQTGPGAYPASCTMGAGTLSGQRAAGA